MLRALVTRFGQQDAQTLQPREHAALDRAQRLIQPLSELRLRETAVVREFDRLPLLGGQAPEGGTDDLSAGACDHGLVGAALRRLQGSVAEEAGTPTIEGRS